MRGNRQDILAGALFAAFGVAALVLGAGYPLGSATRMGAGYFPLLLGVALVALGLLLAGAGLFARLLRLPPLAWRPLLAVLGGGTLFALAVERAGLIVATLAAVALARLARAEHDRRETLWLALCLALLAAALFRGALGLPLPVWPSR